MKKLIVPCAGRSSRYPDTKPKYLLTHPDGKIMLEHALIGIDIEQFDQVIITIVKEHDNKYNASLIINQAFKEYVDKGLVTVCCLDDYTKSASETIYKTIVKNNITEGQLVIKDCDNYVKVNIPRTSTSFCVGVDINKFEISNLNAKSFLYLNEQNLIKDIIEKRVVSDIICVGVYGFKEVRDFVSGYELLLQKGIQSELYISNVISYMINEQGFCFEGIYADEYEDWGTLKEWTKLQDKMKTYFIDVDGVILSNSGRYGIVNWSNNCELLEKNVRKIIELQKQGGQIVITTARTEEYRKKLENLLHGIGIFPHSIVMGLNHSSRVLVNDFAPTNPYPSAVAISIPRNGDLTRYIK